jgi:hypothetical protein
MADPRFVVRPADPAPGARFGRFQVLDLDTQRLIGEPIEYRSDAEHEAARLSQMARKGSWHLEEELARHA